MARSISPDIQHVVTSGGQLLAQVEVRDRNGENVLLTTNPDTDAPKFSVIDGKVTTDETRSVWGSGDIELICDDGTIDDVIPESGADDLSPVAGSTMQINFSVPGSTQAPCEYGRYRLDSLSLTEAGSGVTASIRVSDFARKVEQAAFFRPRVITKGTSYSDGFLYLLQSVLTDSEIVTDDSGRFTGVHTWDIQDDRLQAVRSLARAIGCRVDFNDGGVGNVRIEDETDRDDDPVWYFSGDDINTVITAAPSRLLTNETVYNGVIAMGESSGSDRPPVRAEAWDSDPASPTFFDPTDPETSSYGPVPFFYVSQFIKTKKQAQQVANARLPKVLGVSERLNIECIPNPGIEPGDPIFVNRPRIKASGTFIVESVIMPLTAQGGVMQIACRERKIFQ